MHKRSREAVDIFSCNHSKFRVLLGTRLKECLRCFKVEMVDKPFTLPKDTLETLCPHTNIVEETNDKSIVCTGCGLVLSARPIENIVKECDFVESRCEFLLDLLERFHLPSSLVTDVTKLTKQFKEELTQNGSIVSFKPREIICFALLETINRLEIGLSPNALALAANIRARVLWKIEQKLLSVPIAVQSSRSFVPRACYYCELSYSHVKAIRDICDKLKAYEYFRPWNVCVAAVKMYCMHKKIKIHYTNLCTELGASATSVNRLVKIVNKKELSLF